MTVSEKYKYAPAQLIAAYIIHESVHAHDKDSYTSIREEQDAYKIATEFWIANSKGVEDPEMDYAASFAEFPVEWLNGSADALKLKFASGDYPEAQITDQRKL